MLLKFNEQFHKYYLENKDGSELDEGFKKPFVSVSKFLEMFTDPFVEDIQAEVFVKSKNNKLGLKNKQEVLNYWKLRRDLGTALHAKREKKEIDMGAVTYERDHKGDKICFGPKELRDLPVGVYSELTVPLMSSWLIGTSDLVTISKVNEKKTIDILDYKTNGEKLVLEPKKFYTKEKGYSDFKYFKAPINHMPCDTLQKYIYQLSAYAYFFERIGYHVGTLKIEAIEMNDKGEELNSRTIDIEYRRNDIVQMISYYNKTKAK